jgi:hypothetical protein
MVRQLLIPKGKPPREKARWLMRATDNDTLHNRVGNVRLTQVKRFSTLPGP